ncbi:MAG: hypothetical protein IPP71_00105 [Bacteroidetes bacterium]|nr:hypothetical protein [Bacteroidota bacterium]
MKKIALLAVLLFTAFSTATFAQNEKKQTTKKTAEQRTDLMVRKLTTELTLTSDQQTQVREIVLKRELMRDAGQLDKDSRERIVGDINTLLSKEQQDKWIEMRKEAKEKYEQKKSTQSNPKEQNVSDDIY